MKVALVQTVLTWEDPGQNRNHFAEMIKSMKESVDLIVLPEMFTTGFTMNPQEVAETMDGETAKWMQYVANKSQSALCGSIVVKEGNSFYNRLLFVFPSGAIQYYDKRHRFTLAGEDKAYSAGSEKLIIEYQGFKICPLICYDLRFPVFSRNVEDYDLLLYVANWPKPRVGAWDILLRARAVENLTYVVGVNRIGEDENQHQYSGHSQVVDELGDYLLEPQEAEGVFVVTLDKEKLKETRSKLNFLNDRDRFTILD